MKTSGSVRRLAAIGLLLIGAALPARAQVPTVSLVANDATATELGPTSGSFTLTRSGSTASTLTVSITRAGSASNGNDYAFVNAAAVFASGQSSLAIVVTPLRDNQVEGEETIEYALAPSASYTIATPEPAVVRLADDPAIVQLIASLPNANEQALQAGAFTLSRSGGDTSVSLVVPLTRAGSASNGNDYGFVSASFVLAANQLSAPVAITPIADNQVEGPESVLFSLGPSLAFLPGTSSGGTVTIGDDPAVVTLAASDASASEAGPDEGRLRLTRSGGDTAVSLNVPLVRAGTASNGSDYAFVPASLNFGAGQLETFIAIAPLRDNAVEGSETVTLSLSPSTNFNPGASAAATVAIEDDPAIVAIVATDASADEQALDGGTIALSRSGGDLANSLFAPILRTGTAINGSDYAFVPSGFTFPAHVASGSIAITPLADNLVEANEVVRLELQGSGTHLIGGPGNVEVTIADDPAVVSIGATVASAGECGSAPGSVTVARGGGDLANSLTTILTRGGSAGNGIDYSFVGSSVVIPAGSNQAQVAIAPIFDEIHENDETVVLALAESPATYVVAPPAAATVTIVNCVIQVFVDGFE